MTKIAYLLGEYPRATDTFIQREIKGLREEGFELKTISIRKPSQLERGTVEQDEERKSTSYILPCSPLKLFMVHFSLFLRVPWRYLSTLKLALTVRHPGIRSFLFQCFYFAEAGLVAQILRKEKVGHIHNHAPDACGYVTMLACKLEKATYSMTLHGYAIFSDPIKWRLREKLEHCLFAVCISQHGISQAMLNSSQSDWHKLKLIHCGVSPESGEGFVKKHNGKGRNILFVGRLDYVKGLPILIEAMAQLKDQGSNAVLNIVGDGPARGDLEKLVESKELGDCVIFHGYRSQRELETYFREADISVLTSFFEGIPVVLIESMIHGVPAVAPCITGIPELVLDGVNGLLTKPADVGDLVKKINILLSDPEMRRRFAEMGRTKVIEEFNLDHQIDELVNTMKKELS